MYNTLEVTEAVLIRYICKVNKHNQTNNTRTISKQACSMEQKRLTEGLYMWVFCTGKTRTYIDHGCQFPPHIAAIGHKIGTLGTFPIVHYSKGGA